MGEARLSKSLIQFSIDGQSSFDLGTNYGGANEDNLPSKDPMQALLHSVPPTLQQATADPGLHQRLLDAQGHVWVDLLWGHCSFLLGLVVHKVLFVPSKSLFPQSCVSSGGCMVEFNGNSLLPPRGLMPYPGLLHPEPCPCSS